MTVIKTNDVLGIGNFEPTFGAELAARYDIPKLPGGPQRAEFLAEHAGKFRVVVTSGQLGIDAGYHCGSAEAGGDRQLRGGRGFDRPGGGR